MSNYYLDKSYIEWLSNLLSINNGFIRFYNKNGIKTISYEDELKIYELFMFFNKLLRYSTIHNISNNILEDDILNEFKETFLCFDCSLIVNYKDYFINIIVLELGGSSDMIIRYLDNLDKISKDDVIDYNDFENWLNDYEYGTINCFNCYYLEEVKATYKVNGIDYRCKAYQDMCNREYGILAKDKNRVYPSPLCRRDNNTKFKNKIN